MTADDFHLSAYIMFKDVNSIFSLTTSNLIKTNMAFSNLFLLSVVVLVGSLLIIGYCVYERIYTEWPWPGFPVAVLPGKGRKPKESYMESASRTIATGLETFSGPFQIITSTGPKIVLPHKYADEIRNRPELDFNEAFRKDFFAHYPGFDGFKASLDNPFLIPQTLRLKLTPSMGLVALHLVDEATDALHEIYGDDPNWRSVAFKQHNLDLIARLSSRVFLGKPICRDRQWLEIAKSHTVHSFLAARDLRAQPFFLRRIMHRFMPHNVAIQRHYTDASRIISTEVERRRRRAEQLLSEGKKPPRVSDAIGWMVEVANGQKVDYVAAQLSLTVSSIHATTEALTVVLLNVASYPEIKKELREEVIQVIGEGGWSKQALYNMKLMDSFLKESQRFQPVAMVRWLVRDRPRLGASYPLTCHPVTLNRKVMQNITLADGTRLPKGAIIMVESVLRDPEIYEKPHEFDPRRFLRLRDKSSNNANQYVSTSNEMFAFGHGKHACPGRFLASSELKVALAHMLLKYDWELDETDTMPKFFDNETAHMTSPTVKLRIRRRREEINLDLDEDVNLSDIEDEGGATFPSSPFTMVKFGPLHPVLPAVARVLAVSVSVPSPRDLFDDPCITFRLPPRAVNATYLDEASVERPWAQPPFGFGYGKWALAWTSIEEYWGWSNMQNEWYPVQSTVGGHQVSDIRAMVIADLNSFQLGSNDTVIETQGFDVPLAGETHAWNYTIPALEAHDDTAWTGWGYDFHAQGAPYFVSYDATTTGVKNVSHGVSVYSAREGGPTQESVDEAAACYDRLGSKTFAALFRSMRRTPTDGRRTRELSWHGGDANVSVALIWTHIAV
ncbi:uncharacterized protein PpBr36_10739 [Pyricularia pennisetigena]|uniref:uncharacterized protein n=1 Tax=Pyricularia pennisetigena TaxID=1578925 RepID=UPI00114E4C75|nr:uncharacterized protein PpBr36_10739 [Pyricularia pennisetigena]TLS20929.1 hypothetical protein PpBr36_10739 [Pyricularia pennisetigena]